jgi:hypothetical protein
MRLKTLRVSNYSVGVDITFDVPVETSRKALEEAAWKFHSGLGCIEVDDTDPDFPQLAQTVGFYWEAFFEDQDSLNRDSVE